MISLANEYYPSRNIRETVLARRREPVVWSNKAPPSCISKDAVNHYQENGFVVLPNLISGKLLRLLQQEMQHLREQYKGSNDEIVIREPDSNTRCVPCLICHRLAKYLMSYHVILRC